MHAKLLRQIGGPRVAVFLAIGIAFAARLAVPMVETEVSNRALLAQDSMGSLATGGTVFLRGEK